MEAAQAHLSKMPHCWKSHAAAKMMFVTYQIKIVLHIAKTQSEK